MSVRPQLAFDLAPSPPSPERSESSGDELGLFGLTLDHRTLFDALASEWIEPSMDHRGRVLVRGSYPESAEREGERPANLIIVRAQVDLRAGLNHTVWSLRKETWVELSVRELGSRDSVLWWPGPLSTHTLVSIEVATNEERARLIGIAKQVSNVSVPPVEVTAPRFTTQTIPAPPVTDAGPGLAESYDRIRGAAAMGWWALPRIPPWFDLLVSSFNPSRSAFIKAVRAIEAPWLAELPWRPQRTKVPASPALDAVLWSAACRVAQGWSERASTKLAAAIAEAAMTAAPDLSEELLAWSKDTRAILRAERDLNEDVQYPVGTALQLVLARSSPQSYKTWAKDLHNIPPAVWWSGALLSGLFCGYRELPSSFRGEPCLREFLARRLLDPGGPAAPLRWSYVGEAVQFQVQGEIVANQARTARGLWYTASLDEARTHAAALALVKQLGWPCLTRSLVLRDQALSLRGGGQLEVVDWRLRVSGEIRVNLPLESVLEEAVEPDEFRRALVIQGGDLRQPPPRRVTFSYEAREATISSASDAPIDRSESADADVPGLYYLPNFLTASESAALIEHIDRAPWLDDLKRRVQHYGWKYNYRAREISHDMHIGPLPDWAQKLAVRMAKTKLMPWVADQVIVNEYVEKQGISKHIDCVPCFEEDIAMVSLVEAWHMRFRPPKSKKRIDRLLEVGSVAIMTGPARYDWTHEIPARKTEPGGWVRGRRISLTFRKVKLA